MAKFYKRTKRTYYQTRIDKHNLNQITDYYQQTKDDFCAIAIMRYAVYPCVKHWLKYYNLHKQMEFFDIARESFMGYTKYYDPKRGLSPFAYLNQTVRCKIFQEIPNSKRTVVRDAYLYHPVKEDVEIQHEEWRHTRNGIVRTNPIVSLSDQDGLSYSHSFESTHYEDAELQYKDSMMQIEDRIIRGTRHIQDQVLITMVKEFAVLLAEGLSAYGASIEIMNSGKYKGQVYADKHITIRKVCTQILKEVYTDES